MTNFPSDFDDDITLPFINNNITEIGGDAINALRDAVFALEQNIGLTGAGTTSSISDRINISLFPDGTIKPSAIASMGLVTLPITEDQIASFAQIPESKLKLDHKTQDLYNYIKDLSNGVNTSLGWISTTGVKLDPHLLGVIFRHTLDQIDVSADTNNFLKNKFELLRDNSNAYTLLNDINEELLFHQFADGSPVSGSSNIITNDGSTYPSNYAHTASGIWLNSSRFAIIPETTQDLQAFADYLDNSSILLYGTRIQNFYSNGISRVSRSSSLVFDGYGSPIVSETPAIAYLLNLGNDSNPFDDIDAGDDIIEFKPSAADLSSNAFDEQFALVRVGDIIRINYGTVEVGFVIKEKKYRQMGGVKKFIVRIAGKNLFYSPNAVARIDRSLVNANKYGVLALAPALNSFSGTPSLIIGNPRGAQALGLGFNPDQFDSSHYNLYLALYPNGFPQDGYTILPAIDVTGNQGKTPGEYTLDSIVNATNNAFRQVGFNYRFIAFSYQGEFGIMLADSYGNAGFSILNAVVDDVGMFDQAETQLSFPLNVIDVFPADGYAPIDPLGIGSTGSAVASPPFESSYGSPEAALQATKIFLPLKRNNYYVNGVEKEKLNLQIDQILDTYGDGYWPANIQAQTSYPGAPPTGRVETTYRIPFDLSSSGLKIGKTLVVQGLGAGTLTDFGRFTIKNVEFSVCDPDIYTDITVYDAVHATGISPVDTLGLNNSVAIYFNSDSVSFNTETATDYNSYSPFKRHFEIYVNETGGTFSHERGRINISGSTLLINDLSSPNGLFGSTDINKLDIVKISPKLRGYQFGSVTKITLRLLSYDDTLGVFDGYLCSYDGTTYTHAGPIITGKKGQITRFYDETYNDYIDIIFDINTVISSFTDRVIDIQLFPTLSLDDEIMLIATCQLNDSNKALTQIRDERQFGNTGEKDFTTSAIDFITLPERVLHSNGIIRGFDLADVSSNPNTSQIYLKGGVCLVNGKVIQMNDETITLPPLKESFSATLYNIDWIICINDKSEYQPIPLLDFDENISNPSSSNRLFQAFNVINSLTYYIDATTFSDLINNRKDLTPLYIARTTVTAGSPPIFDISLIDARKYINDADSNLPLRLTVGEAQGNFRSVESILTWIRFNGQYNGSAYVRGASISSGIINDAITLNFTNEITFDGESNAVLTFNGHVTLGSHVTFKNVSIIFNGGVTVLSASSNITFENCIIEYNSPLTSSASGDFAFSFSNCTLIKFIDSLITATYTQSLTDSAFIYVSSTNQFSMQDCVINISFTYSAGVTIPADVIWLENSPNATIILTNIFGNFRIGVKNISSSGMQLKDGVMQSSYDPSLDGIYDSRDLVNSGNGYFYANVSALLDGLIIDNMFFNYLPAVASESRYSFINFELSAATSSLTDLQITNCRFNDLNTGTILDGYKTAISIINIAPSASPVGFQPFAYNVNISHNICNKNQAIIISSKTVDDGYSFDGYAMGYPGLAAVNVNIEKNICGTIGYWISSGTKIINIPIFSSSYVDKSASLVISKNICHYIAAMTSRGQFFRASRSISGSSQNMCPYYTSGFVTISKNTANWIHTGIAFEEDSALHITNNTLVAYDQNYIGVSGRARYGDNLDSQTASGFSYGYNMAISVSSNIYNAINLLGNDGSVIIRGNTTNPGYFYTSIATTAFYYYNGGYIYCQSSNNITQNFLRGFNPASIIGAGIVVGGVSNIVTQNKIYRGAGIWGNYVTFQNPDYPAWDTTTFSHGLIVDNFFDSTTTDGSFENVAVVSASQSRWIIERNNNQTVTISIPMTNHQLLINRVFANFDSSGDPALKTAPPLLLPDYSEFKSNTLWYHVTAGTSIPVGWQENISKYLSAGARLIEIKMGVRVFQTSPTPLTLDSGSFVVLSLNRYAEPNTSTNLDWAGATAGTVVDANITNNSSTSFTSLPPAAPTGTQTYASLGGTIPFNIGTTQYLTINTETLGVSDQFVANASGYAAHGFGISVQFDIIKSSGPTLDVYFSPISIKYRW